MSPQSARRLRDRLATALRGEAGAATTELVIATPLLLLCLLTIVQFALWSHATHIAQTAAAAALTTTRLYGGTATAGEIVGRQRINELNGPLTDVHIETERTADTATTRVSGNVTSVLPFLHLTASADAIGPVERVATIAYEVTNSESFTGASRSSGDR